MTAYICF